MKPYAFVGCLALMLAMNSCMMPHIYAPTVARVKPSPFEQVAFGDLLKKYMNKNSSSIGTIEGVYSVSSVITKKNKPLFSSVEREKVKDRNENYATVAIIHDPNGQREFLEISMDKDNLASYSVRGEFNAMSDGNILVYKHFEPKGKASTYTFTYDGERDILEGIRTDTNGNSTVTYTLTYLKLYPKASQARNR